MLPVRPPPHLRTLCDLVEHSSIIIIIVVDATTTTAIVGMTTPGRTTS